MKLTFTLFVVIIIIGDGNALNPLKVPDSIKGKVFSAAGKFLSGKNAKNPAISNAATVTNPNGKTSRMSQLVDLGTNAAMALAGAGTLFQALSSDKTPPTPPTPVSSSRSYFTSHF